MAFLSTWPDRLLKIAETTESLLARMDFDCAVRAWRVSGPPGASLLLGISSPELVSAEALEALRYYLVPRINARLGLDLRVVHVRIVNLDVEVAPEEAAAIPSELMRKMLGRTGPPSFEASVPAPLATLPLPLAVAGQPAGGFDVYEFSDEELRKSFDATAPPSQYPSSRPGAENG